MSPESKGISLNFVTALGWCLAIFFMLTTLSYSRAEHEQYELTNQARVTVAQAQKEMQNAARVIGELNARVKDQAAHCVDTRWLAGVVR